MQTEEQVKEHLEYWTGRYKRWEKQNTPEAETYAWRAQSLVTLLYTILDVPLSEREIRYP